MSHETWKWKGNRAYIFYALDFGGGWQNCGSSWMLKLIYVHLDIHLFLLLLPDILQLPQGLGQQQMHLEGKATGFCCKWPMAALGGGKRLMCEFSFIPVVTPVLDHTHTQLYFSNCQSGWPLRHQAQHQAQNQEPYRHSSTSSHDCRNSKPHTISFIPRTVIKVLLLWFRRISQSESIPFTLMELEMLVAHSGRNVYQRQVEWWLWCSGPERDQTVSHIETVIKAEWSCGSRV